MPGNNLIAFRAANANIAFNRAPAVPDAAAAAPAANTNAPPPGFVRAAPATPTDVDALLDRFESGDLPTSAPNVSTVEEPATELVLRDRPMLLYNSLCEVCQVLSAWVKKSDAAGEDLIDEQPIPDDPEALKKLHPDLDIWEVYQEIHLLMPDGTVKTGGEAIGEVLKRLPGFHLATWTLDVGIGDFKPAQLMLNGAYKLLDAIRPALGCSSCGGGPVAWWAKPIRWGADLVHWVKGGDDDAPAVSEPAQA